jgi:hypothetical protein
VLQFLSALKFHKSQHALFWGSLFFLRHDTITLFPSSRTVLGPGMLWNSAVKFGNARIIAAAFEPLNPTSTGWKRCCTDQDRVGHIQELEDRSDRRFCLTYGKN